MPILSAQERAFVTKHDAKLKAADKKFADAMAELEKARKLIATSKPANVPPELADAYAKQQAAMLRTAGYLDRYYAEIKQSMQDVLRVINQKLQEK
jgi:hypothetical protein